MNNSDNSIGARIDSLLDTYLADYEKKRNIDREIDFEYPNKEAIVEILNKLRKIIFPGYFKNKEYKVYTARNNISMPVEDVIFNLIKQIKLVLKYSEKYRSLSKEDAEHTAEELTFAFMEKIPKIRENIDTDVQAAFDGDPAAYSIDEIIFSYPGLYAILVNRIAHELYLLDIPLIPRIMTEHAHSETGIDIHPGASIGKYFFIDHGTGIVIGETTEIGDHVKIYQGVTLGALSTKGGQELKNSKRHPTILDNVTIYSGASILGGETVVGKDVVVGGNAFITRSIPEGAKVTVKNQQLRYNYDALNPIERAELDDDSWFYII